VTIRSAPRRRIGRDWFGVATENLVPLADQTLVSGVNFLTAIMLARALGLVGFGIFSLTWLVVLIVFALQTALISAPMMSIGPKQARDDEPAYFGAIFLQQAAVTVMSVVVVYGGVAASAAAFPNWNLSGTALPLSLTVAGHHAQDFLRRYFFTRRRGYVALSLDAIRYGGQLALLAWLMAADSLSVEIALWAIAATSAVSILVAGPFVEALAWHRASFAAVTLRHWRFSRWLAASAVLQFSSGNLFLIAAGALLGPAAVGALRAAQNLMGVVHIFTLGLENIVPVRAGWHFHHHGNSGLFGYLKRVALFGGGGTIAVAFVVGIAPEFWLDLVFGGVYAGFGNLVQWFAVFYLVALATFFLRAALRAIEHTVAILIATVASVSVALAAAYPLVNAFGATGAVAGMVLAQVAGATLLFASLVKGAMRDEPND